tara:strand:+ start:1152 stop:1343 length:192 start_codon:yes stop_codon:yes gene_type:complete
MAEGEGIEPPCFYRRHLPKGCIPNLPYLLNLPLLPIGKTSWGSLGFSINKKEQVMSKFVPYAV